MDFIFFGLTGASIFVFRRREARLASGPPHPREGYRVPGHPYTTALFVVSCWLVVINTIYKYPANTLLGMVILALGVPVYAFWAHRSGRAGL
jgi:APA family basic amino acid/polyamine antiporter